MINVTFPTGCPFASFFRGNASKQKSFIRSISGVRYAVMDYNIHNGYTACDLNGNTSPKFVWNRYVWITDEIAPVDGVLANMVYETEDKKHSWVIVITETE